MRGRRVSIGLAAVLISGVSIPAAAAFVTHSSARTTVTSVVPNVVRDPAGDVPTGQGDITAAGFIQSASGLTFGVKVKMPVNPKTDQIWLKGLPFVYFGLDANHDQLPEYLVILIPNFSGGLQAELGSLEGSGVCHGTGNYIASYGYTATFATRCLPFGFTFRFQAAMQYPADATETDAPTDVAPDGDTYSPTLRTAAVAARASSSGYWMLGADGRVYPFGGAVGFPGVVPDAAAMAPRGDGRGYWVTDRAGQVRAFGSAAPYGGSPALKAGERITSMSATPGGKGYWLFSNTGRAFAFGDAHAYGDMSGTPLNGGIVASTATPSGQGYYMIGADGGIFAFGDARFHGSTGGMHLNQPIVGMSPTRKGDGYWLVGADGGVFAFHAPFRGSMGAVRLNRPVDGLVAFGDGYLMGAADGGVFNFSNTSFAGSLADHPPTAPIIGIAAFVG